MTVRFYSSTDASAPVLSGTGNFVDLLDAILVTGYGSQPAAGWTKPFTGTNKAAFLMATTGDAPGYYVRILDQLDSGRGVAWRCYKTMSDVDTGTNPVPTVAQVPGNGISFWKSEANSAAARGWFCVADDRGFMFVSARDSATSFTVANTQTMYVGQMEPAPGLTRSALDVAVHGSNAGTAFATNATTLGAVRDSVSFSAAAVSYISANIAGLDGSFPVCRRPLGLNTAANSTAASLVGPGVPDPITGVLRLCPIYAFEESIISFGTNRGRMPYILSIDGPISTSQILNNIEIVGENSTAGQTFVCRLSSSASQVTYLFFQTSGSR